VRTIDPKKLDALKRRLRTKPAKALPKLPLVQKNLSIPKDAAARMKALAERDGLTQAALVIQALDAYEALNGQ
jgi:hypothetical protein